MHRIGALGGVLLVVASTLVAQSALAHQSPANCSSSAIGVQINSDRQVIRPGQTVTYTVFVSNVIGGGNIACDVTNATVTGTRPDGTTVVIASGLNFPSGTQSAVVIGAPFTYTLPAGSMADSLTASATVSGTSHTANGDVLGTGFNQFVIGVTRPATTLTKAANVTSVRAGGTVTYTFTETNTGNAPIGNVVVTDSKCAPLVRGADAPGNNDATLSPGETFTYTCTRSLALANADPGTNPPSVTDVATATGTDLADNAAAPGETSNAVLVIIANPATVLTKTRLGPATVPPGTPVTYTYTEQNTGTDPISSVVVTDDKCAPVTRGADAPGNNDAILAPGETFTYTCTISFAASGAVTNTATATGTDTVDGLPAPQETAQATVTVSRPQPSITTTASSVGTGPGATLTDTATIVNGASPTGLVTFRLFRDAACTNQAFTSTNPVTTTGATTGTASSTPFVTTGAGTFYFTAQYLGDAANLPAGPTGCLDAGEQVPVARALPLLTTTATPTAATVGSNIHDVANITNGFNPSGTVTFTLFNDPVCASQVFTSTNPVSTTGTPAAPSALGTATSDDFMVNAPGTYHWRAVYSGDANNAPTVLSSCADPAETVTVTKAQPAIATTASPSVPVGSTIHDTATVTGGFNPSGNVSFSLYGPGDTACATSIFDSTGSLSGGVATSGGFVTTAPGTYRFRAFYPGDLNNLPASSGCADAAEQVVVTQAAPNLSTIASPGGPAGSPIHDTANLSGGDSPSGTVTFQLFGPADPTCAAAPIFVSANRPVIGTGATSADFTPTAPGTYSWRATYNGDARNAAVGPTPCSDPLEQAVVVKAGPSISTRASAPVPLGGGTISDTATLAGAVAPTGTVTFRLFKDDVTCAAASQVFTSDSTVAPATGIATSGPFTPTAAGTYRWTALFNGDASNAAAGPTACNDTAESVIVAPANPLIVTKASPPVPVGGTVTDVATLSGAVTPTGTITFRVFGPDNSNCAGTPVFTSTKTVTANGDYTSDPFTTTGAGVYRFVVSYSGDANNAAVGPTGCGDALETTAGTKLTPRLTTMASPGVQVGGALTDTATLAGGANPTGTITFRLYGPNDTNCTAPPVFVSTRTAAGSGNYTSDPFTLSAPGVYRWVASYGGDANNNPAPPTLCGDLNETVGGAVAAGSIGTVASGGVTLGNTVNDTATLSGFFNPTGTLTFRLYGPDAADCNGTAVFTSVKTVTGNGNYTSDAFPPAAPGTYRWVATYSGDATNASAVTSCLDPMESVVVTPLPTIKVAKSATPPSLPVPGGTFTFNVVVTNNSNVTLTITNLVDNVYPNITGRPGSTCNTAIGTVLAPAATYSCAFTGDFTGPSGAAQTDTVKVTGVDNRGNVVTDTAKAIVTITPLPPQITTTKAALPLSLPEPGGTFNFTYSVTNTGPEAVTVTKIVDNVYGDLNGKGTCAIGARLNPGGVYRCGFTGSFIADAGAKQTDTITTTAVDDRGVTVTSQANATVTITDVPPTVQIVKTPNPSSLPEPGGTFRFTVKVTNTSFEPIKTTSLVDNIYGDLNGKGTCAIGATLAASGGTYTCAFDGDFRGKAGDAQTDTVTVIAIDNDNSTVTAKANATVTLTPMPAITTTKTATPPSLPEPGGTFTFNFSVTNTGAEAVTVQTLMDDVYGNLNGRGTCAVGTRLASGATYSCSFTGSFLGNAGAAQKDTITTTAVNDRGQTVVSKATATVAITDVPPTIKVTKSPDPPSRVAPGGTFTFSVVVTNTSFEPITTTALTDDIYGDLNGRGNCAIGAVLAPNGGTYSCTFPGDFFGQAGDRQTDTVTVTAVDNDNTSVTAQAKATVFLTPVPVVPFVPPVVPPPVLPVVLVPPVIPPVVQPVVQQPLVRTGADVAGPARLAAMLVILGLLMLGATWRRSGQLQLAPLPTGPGGGTWFSPPPGGRWSGPMAGLGMAPPPPPSAPVQPGLGAVFGAPADPDDAGPAGSLGG